jgi:integrase
MQSNLLKKLAGSTVHLVQSVLWDVLEQAVTLQLITSNPLRGLARPQKTKGDYHALTVEESISYMQACERVPQRYGLALIFALQTGLRPEELCGLKWSNIELTQASARTPAQGIVKVRQVVQEMGDGNWHWSEPKTKNGRRSVCFSVALYQRLQDHRRWQLERRLRFGRTWNAEDLVFPSQLGTPLKQQRLRDRHAAVLTVAGLPLNLRVYDLRHAFVTLSLVAGVDPKTVSREAGHASVAFTLDHYGHVLEEQYEEAGLKRAELFAQRGKVLAK